MFKKFPSNKINVTKNAFFSSVSSSFTFKSQFLYELKHKVCLSFLLKLTFLFNNKHGFFDVNPNVGGEG